MYSLSTLSANSENFQTAVTRRLRIAGSFAITPMYAYPGNLIAYYQTVMLAVNGHPIRALFDSSAPRSYITRRAVERLCLEPYQPKGDPKCTRCPLEHNWVRVILSALVNYGDKDVYKMPVILTVLSCLYNLPEPVPAISGHYRQDFALIHSPVADTIASENVPVEIVLGLDVYGRLWQPSNRQFDGDDLEYEFEDFTLRQSIFGFTAFGVTLKDVVYKDKLC